MGVETVVGVELVGVLEPLALLEEACPAAVDDNAAAADDDAELLFD